MPVNLTRTKSLVLPGGSTDGEGKGGAIEGTISGFRQDYGRHQVIKRQAGNLDHS